MPWRFTSALAQKGRGEHEEYPVGRGRLEPVGVPWTPNLWDLMSGVVEDAGHILFRAQKKILYHFLYLQDVSFCVDHVEYVNLGLSHFSIAVRDNRDILWPLVDS